MRKYPRRRDDNEPEIIRALRAAGAIVVQLDGAGLPDLLVGFRGRTHLLEVKRPVTATGKTTGGATRPVNGGDGVLTAAQLKFHDGWRGAAIAIVASPAEALAAVGAQSKCPTCGTSSLSIDGRGSWLCSICGDGYLDVDATPDDIAPTSIADSSRAMRCSGCDLVFDAAGRNVYTDGVRPPVHWVRSDRRPLPLCPGFGRAGIPIDG